MPDPKKVNETRDQIKGVNQYQHLGTTGEERALLAADQGKATRSVGVPATDVPHQPEGPRGVTVSGSTGATAATGVTGVTGPTGATGPAE